MAVLTNQPVRSGGILKVSTSFQDLTLKHGWRTGAIIPELRKEIKIMNTEQYVHMVTWLQALTGLIEQMQVRLEIILSLLHVVFSPVLSLPL